YASILLQLTGADHVFQEESLGPVVIVDRDLQSRLQLEDWTGGRRRARRPAGYPCARSGVQRRRLAPAGLGAGDGTRRGGRTGRVETRQQAVDLIFEGLESLFGRLRSVRLLAPWTDGRAALDRRGLLAPGPGVRHGDDSTGRQAGRQRGQADPFDLDK